MVEAENMGGRPTDYTPAMVEEICYRLMQGESLRKIELDPKMPAKSTVLRWLARHPEFEPKYAAAKQIQVECVADEMIDIADDDTADLQFKEIETEHGKEARAVFLRAAVERSKLRINTRQWMAERLAPKKYGGKPDIQIAYPEPLTLHGPDGKVLSVLGFSGMAGLPGSEKQ